ncbi:MAG: acyl-CoA dehydrogenase family protein [Deltaproteobacteria bacterium]
MQHFRFDLQHLPPEADVLRHEVRSFLADALADLPRHERARTWFGVDTDFTRRVGERGWIGMTWPSEYGGAERSFLERFVVLEEMLAAGAPVAAHWMADRQSGPLLLRFGSEEQKRTILPGICRGETYFCIGMSEPDTGSDLASVRARAQKTSDGWRLEGTKLWTSGAAMAHFMVGLFRSGEEERHAGLSQFLIPMDTPGIQVRPIRDLAGSDHFCEVVFDAVDLPADALIGEEGGGWKQVMAELAYERSGPERYLSCHPLLEEMVRELGPVAGERAEVEVGHQVAWLATMRTMSTSVASLLHAGESPDLEAAVVKDLGAVYEQDQPGRVQELLGMAPSRSVSASTSQKMLAHLVMNAPSFSLRGGTREILRGIIARGLGLR